MGLPVEHPAADYFKWLIKSGLTRRAVVRQSFEPAPASRACGQMEGKLRHRRGVVQPAAARTASPVRTIWPFAVPVSTSRYRIGPATFRILPRCPSLSSVGHGDGKRHGIRRSPAGNRGHRPADASQPRSVAPAAPASARSGPGRERSRRRQTCTNCRWQGVTGRPIARPTITGDSRRMWPLQSIFRSLAPGGDFRRRRTSPCRDARRAAVAGSDPA